MIKESFTVKEAAEFLGVTTSTIRRWEESGKLNPNFRTLGGHRRYSKHNLQALKESRTK